MQQQQQEHRTREIRAAAKAKQEVIDRAQQQQQAAEKMRRNGIIQLENQKQQRLEVKTARETEARRLLQHEKVLQEAAARGRVERTMGDLQAQLQALEGQLETRERKVDAFVTTRDANNEAGQRASVRSALERTQLANSMTKMRGNLTNNATLFLDVPTDRRNVQNRELKALLDRVDPEGQGHISLASMRRTLTKLLPPPSPERVHAKRTTSQSMPSLLTLEQRQMSQYDQYVAAFKAVDSDNSGSISKRELYQVLKVAGLANGKQALELFDGFDEDQSGSLEFEEFMKIAKIVC